MGRMNEEYEAARTRISEAILYVVYRYVLSRLK